MPDRSEQAAIGWASRFLGRPVDRLPAGEPGEGDANPLAKACGIRLWWHDTDLDGIPFAIFFLAPGEDGFWRDTPDRQITGDVADFIRRFMRGEYPHLHSGLEPAPAAFVIGEMRGFHHLGNQAPDLAGQAQIFLAVQRAQQHFDDFVSPTAPPANDDDVPF